MAAAQNNIFFVFFKFSIFSRWVRGRAPIRPSHLPHFHLHLPLHLHLSHLHLPLYVHLLSISLPSPHIYRGEERVSLTPSLHIYRGEERVSSLSLPPSPLPLLSIYMRREKREKRDGEGSSGCPAALPKVGKNRKNSKKNTKIYIIYIYYIYFLFFIFLKSNENLSKKKKTTYCCLFSLPPSAPSLAPASSPPWSTPGCRRSSPPAQTRCSSHLLSTPQNGICAPRQRCRGSSLAS